MKENTKQYQLVCSFDENRMRGTRIDFTNGIFCFLIFLFLLVRQLPCTMFANEPLVATGGIVT